MRHSTPAPVQDARRSNTDALRKYRELHIDENQEGITGTHRDALYYNCTFDKLNSVQLLDSVLTKSKFKTSRVKDALGFALTLDCHSFDNVEYSPLLFDLLLVLLMKTTGNTDKRRKLIEVVGRERVAELLREMAAIERA